MKKPPTKRFSNKFKRSAHKKDEMDEVPELTRELLERSVLMPPITQFKSAKEYMAYYKAAIAKNNAQKKQVSFSAEPEVYRWLKSQGEEAPMRVNALLKDYIHMLEQHGH